MTSTISNWPVAVPAIRRLCAVMIAVFVGLLSTPIAAPAARAQSLATTTYDALSAGYDHPAPLARIDSQSVLRRGPPIKPSAASVRDSVSILLVGVAAKGAMDIRPPLSIGSKQFGAKWGKHAADYGLDPASSSSRSWFMNRARDVHLNPDEVRRGAWNPVGGGGDNYFFFRQGDDLLITQPGGEFVTMFPGGRTNAWFKNAEVFPH